MEEFGVNIRKNYQLEVDSPKKGIDKVSIPALKPDSFERSSVANSSKSPIMPNSLKTTPLKKSSVSFMGSNGYYFPVEKPSIDLNYSDCYTQQDSLDKMTQAFYERHQLYSLVDEKTGVVKDDTVIKNSPQFYSKIKGMEIENTFLTPDKKGVRGSSLFSKTNKRYLSKVKEAGIERVIDLRAEAKERSKELCESMGMEYVHIPIYYGEKYSSDMIYKLQDLINAVEKGKYYIGCNEGTNRTDVAMGLNYLFNPKDNPPVEFKSLMPQKSLSMLRKAVNEILGKDQNKQWHYDKNAILNLGWKNVEEFETCLLKRMKTLYK